MASAVVTALKPVLAASARWPTATRSHPPGRRLRPRPIKATGTVRVCYVAERPPYAFIEPRSRAGRARRRDGAPARHRPAGPAAVACRSSAADVRGRARAGQCDIVHGRHRRHAGPRGASRRSRAPYTRGDAWPSSCRITCATSTTRGPGSGRAGTVRIGFPDLPYFRRQLEQRLPEATLVPVSDDERACSPTRAGHSRRWCCRPSAARS